MMRLTSKSWIGIGFKLQDFWVGAFWAVKPANYYSIHGHIRQDLHVWICIIPCFPIHYIRSVMP